MRPNQVRLLIFVLLLLFSIYFVFSPYFFERKGVIVKLVENEKCTLKENSIISEMKNVQIKNAKDFLEIEKNVKKGETITFIANNEPAICVAIEDGNLGVKVSDVPSKKIKFSGEIQGWHEITFSANKSELNKIKNTIEARIDFFKFPSTSVEVENENLKIKTIVPEEIFLLVDKGEIEARIEQEIKLENDTGNLLIGDDVYKLKVANGEIEVNGFLHKINESFLINEFKFFVANVTNKSIVIEATVFDNSNLKLAGQKLVRYQPETRMYRGEIPVIVSKQGGEKFANVTKNLPALPVQPMQLILQGRLIYYLDGQKISELSIPYEMKGKKVETIAIIFFAKNEADALSLGKKIEAGLIGVLPEVNFISERILEPSHKQLIFYGNLIFWTIFCMLFLILNRKNLLNGLKTICFAFACVFILFGIASASQQLFSYGWILDIYSFLGIFAFAISFLAKETIKKKASENKILKNFELIALAIGFCFLFIMRGFGMALFFGILIKILLVNKLLEI